MKIRDREKVMNITAIPDPSCNPPNGMYHGLWSGYELRFGKSREMDEYRIRTKKGVRGRVSVVVTVSDNGISAEKVRR